MSKKRDRSAYMKTYRAKNLERIQAYNRQYYWNHREQMLAYGKKYREKMNATMTDEEREERRAYMREMARVYKQIKREEGTNT